MKGYRYCRSLWYQYQILFQPIELYFVQIADVSVCFSSKEYIIEYHIMYLTSVEGVISRAEIILKSLFRSIIRSACYVHIVVAYRIEKRYSCTIEYLFY